MHTKKLQKFHLINFRGIHYLGDVVLKAVSGQSDWFFEGDLPIVTLYDFCDFKEFRRFCCNIRLNFKSNVVDRSEVTEKIGRSVFFKLRTKFSWIRSSLVKESIDTPNPVTQLSSRLALCLVSENDTADWLARWKKSSETSKEAKEPKKLVKSLKLTAQGTGEDMPAKSCE